MHFFSRFLYDKKVNGFFGRLLRIDLSKRGTVTEPIPESVLRSFLGGKGLGSYLLLRENLPHISPFSPENRLIFTLGPLADTPFYGSSRYAVFTKSPQTGIYSESYSGGEITLSLSRTGYDAIIIEGRSKGPVFLEISDREVIFHDASDLWGKETYEAEEAIVERIGVKGTRALTIGPAGENRVRFAVIESERGRSLGRAGIGAVMGSKRLKGIGFHGTKRRRLADPSSLKKLSQEFKTASRRGVDRSPLPGIWDLHARLHHEYDRRFPYSILVQGQIGRLGGDQR